MTLRERLEEELRKGEEAARVTGILPSTWIKFFGFETNPFDRSPLDPVRLPSDIEKFVGSEEILRELARLVGLVAASKTGHSYGLIGPDGMGKRSFGRAVYSLANGSGYHAVLHSTFRRTVVFPEGYEPGEYPEPPDDDWDVVILEENRPTMKAVSNMRLFRKRGVLLVSTWRPEEIDDTVEFDREASLAPLTHIQASQLLRTRIETSGGALSDITENAIEAIAFRSKGIPGLCLQLAEACYDWAFRKKQKPLTEREILEAAQRYGFDFPENLPLSTKDRDVVRYLLSCREPDQSKTVTVKQLVDGLGMDRILAWRYLERLSRRKMLQKRYHGKAGIYELTRVAAIRLQFELGSWRS